MQIIRFFCAMTDRCKPCLHKGWNGAKKGCAQHNGLLLEAPAASGTGMPEAKSRCETGMPEAKSRCETGMPEAKPRFHSLAL